MQFTFKNKILYGQYLQFNGPTTLPSGAQPSAMELPRVRVSYKARTEQEVALLFRFGYSTTCCPQKGPAKTRRLSPNCPPTPFAWRPCVPTDISKLLCAFGTNRRSLTVLSCVIFASLQLNFWNIVLKWAASCPKTAYEDPSFVSVSAVVPNIAPVRVEFS